MFNMMYEKFDQYRLVFYLLKCTVYKLKTDVYFKMAFESACG